MALRSYLFLTTVCMLSCNTPLFSQDKLPEEPYVKFPATLMNQLAGMGAGARSKGILTCTEFLKKTWPYPNAQVTSFCYDAETACIRYDLFLEQIKSGNMKPTANQKQSLELSRADAQMKLEGCAMALEFMMSGKKVKNLIGATGSYKAPDRPLTNLTPATPQTVK
ncbi:MAG: hypothetical protein JSR85_06375 [Proteobacteria bacterium]|nr:hypothetical protein [Pseudomonadota bacterium]